MLTAVLECFIGDCCTTENNIRNIGYRTVSITCFLNEIFLKLPYCFYVKRLWLVRNRSKTATNAYVRTIGRDHDAKVGAYKIVFWELFKIFFFFCGKTQTNANRVYQNA